MTEAHRKIVIIYGNDRPDIRLIYDEVADQARKNGLEVLVYLPGNMKFRGKSSAIPWGRVVSSEPLNPRHLIRAWNAWRRPDRFINGGRIRGWTLIDFLSFQTVLAREQPAYVFCLEQGHARGAVYACDDKSVPLITHQHGDYYHPRGSHRCFEGESGCCLVWNSAAANYLSGLRRNGDIVVAGSLKHVRLMRERLPAAPIENLVFLDTYMLDHALDLQRAKDQADLLHDVKSLTRMPCYVRYHPIRTIDSKNGLHSAVREIYASRGLAPFEGLAAASSIAITGESNAIYDMISRGIPTIYLVDFNEVLSLGAGFPSAAHGRGEELSRKIASEVAKIAASPDAARQDQLAHIQAHVIGNQENLDRRLSEIFARR